MDEWVAAAVDVAPLAEPPKLTKERVEFTKHLRRLLRALGHSEVSEDSLNDIHVDDQYVVYRGQRRLRSLGSASDHPRLVASYVLALAEAAVTLKSPHPGFVLLDEPLQQNPDPKRRAMAIELFAGLMTARAGQTIILTSLTNDEIKGLAAAKLKVEQLPGANFLQRVV